MQKRGEIHYLQNSEKSAKSTPGDLDFKALWMYNIISYNHGIIDNQ